MKESEHLTCSVQELQQDCPSQTCAKHLLANHSRLRSNSALRFQPIRRPQVNQKKPTKPGFPKAVPSSSNTAATSPPNETKDPSTNTTPAAASAAPVPPPPTSTPPPGHAPPPRTTTLADWAAANNDEDEYLWGAGASEKRQRGGRRAKRKRQQQQFANNSYRETDWDEIYDPARPTNVDEYLRSDERVREVQEWKAVLYAHRRRRRGSFDEDDSEEDSEVEGRAGLGSEYHRQAVVWKLQVQHTYTSAWLTIS